MNYEDIPAYPIYGISSDDAALTCTGKGFIPWQAQTGDVLYIPCYYSEQAADTIISPTDVVLCYSSLFSAFSKSMCTGLSIAYVIAI